jgi:hypothetical protein
LATERPGDAGDAGERRPDDPGHGHRGDGAQQGHPDEHDGRSQPEERQGAAAAGEQAPQHGGRAEDADHQPGDGPAAQRSALLDPSALEGGHRRDLRRPAGRGDRRQDGDDQAHHQGHDDGAGEDLGTGGGQVDPEGLEQALQPEGDEDAEPQPDDRREEADHAGLGDHRHHHLAAAGPQGPQEGQLAGPLGHQDRERVEDDEAADEQRDAGEHQQGGAEEAEGLLHRLGALVRHLLAGDHLDAGRQDLGHAVAQLQGRHAADRLHVDGVEGRHLAQHPLGRGHVEGGQGGAGQVVRRAETGDAHDGEVLGRALEQDLDRVPDPDLVGLGRARVDDDFAVGAGLAPGTETKGRQVPVGRPAHAQCRGTAGGDRLAVLVDELGVTAHRALGHAHARDLLDRVQYRRRDRVPGRVGGGALAEAGGGPDGHVDSGVDGVEQHVERVVDRVGEDECPGHEADAQHDGEAGQEQPQLVGEDPFEDGVDHP